MDREQSPEARHAVSMVVENEENESIFTKDERLVRYERIQEITYSQIDRKYAEVYMKNV